MFKEIYNGLVDLFNPLIVNDTEMKSFGTLGMYLYSAFNIDIHSMKRLKRVELPDGRNLMFLLAAAPEEAPMASYSDFLLMEGKLYHVILFNTNKINPNNPEEIILDGIMTPIRQLGNYLIQQAYLTTGSVDNAGCYLPLMYAPALLFIGLIRALRKLRGWAPYTHNIAHAMAGRYGCPVGIENVESIYEMFDNEAKDTSSDAIFIDIVLDNNGLTLLTDDYPDTFFFHANDTAADKAEEEAEIEEPYEDQNTIVSIKDQLEYAVLRDADRLIYTAARGDVEVGRAILYTVERDIIKILSEDGEVNPDNTHNRLMRSIEVACETIPDMSPSEIAAINNDAYPVILTDVICIRKLVRLILEEMMKSFEYSYDPTADVPDEVHDLQVAIDEVGGEDRIDCFTSESYGWYGGAQKEENPIEDPNIADDYKYFQEQIENALDAGATAEEALEIYGTEEDDTPDSV